MKLSLCCVLPLLAMGQFLGGGGGTAPTLLGGDRDEHGCKGSAGYSYCWATQKCEHAVGTVEVSGLEGVEFKGCPSKEEVEKKALEIAAGSVLIKGVPVDTSKTETPAETETPVTTDAPVDIKIGGNQDEGGCFTSAGYAHCKILDACVRQWETVAYKDFGGVEFTGCPSEALFLEKTTKVTDPPVIGGDKDEGGCYTSAGYAHCKILGACVRDWETVAYKDFGGVEFKGCPSEAVFLEKTTKTTDPPVIGGGKDEGGCYISAGYAHCKILKTCVRSWETKTYKEFGDAEFTGCPSEELFKEKTTKATDPPVIGGDKDEGGCYTSAGYAHCKILKTCVRSWETKKYTEFGNAEFMGCPSEELFKEKTAKATDPPVIGGAKDAKGCYTSAGYAWCETLKTCVRSFETKKYSEYNDLEFKGCPTESEFAEKMLTVTGTRVGGKDVNGCCSSCGESYCESEKKCYMAWKDTCKVEMNDYGCPVDCQQYMIEEHIKDCDTGATLSKESWSSLGHCVNKRAAKTMVSTKDYCKTATKSRECTRMKPSKTCKWNKKNGLCIPQKKSPKEMEKPLTKFDVYMNVCKTSKQENFCTENGCTWVATDKACVAKKQADVKCTHLGYSICKAYGCRPKTVGKKKKSNKCRGKKPKW